MGATGLVGLGNGAPVPDAERVATIRFSILDDTDACAAFGEGPRAALAELNARAHLALSSSGYDDCRALLARLKDGLNALDTTRLEPPRGLAGLFDSRAGRLKAFRAAWTAAAPLASETAAEIAQRGRAAAGRGRAIEDLWTQTRDALTDLDAHIVAARAWLADRGLGDATPAAPPGPVDAPEPESDPPPSPVLHEPHDQSLAAMDTDEPAPAEAQPAAGVTAPHPLLIRLDSLIAARSSAVAALPLLRAMQNAAEGLAARLAALPEAIDAWRLDWRDGLGLAGKRPRKVRPDPNRLDQARQGVIDTIAETDARLADAISRLAELGSRVSGAGKARISIGGGPA